MLTKPIRLRLRATVERLEKKLMVVHNQRDDRGIALEYMSVVVVVGQLAEINNISNRENEHEKKGRK